MFFIQENVFENVVCKMSAILFEQNGWHSADNIFKF